MSNSAALRRLALRGFLVAAALYALARWQERRLPPPEALGPELLQAPLQGATDRGAFDFEYKGKRCLVRAVASYELWGLIVSQNDIHSFSDIYHDATSVDTRDLCVVWGGNVESGSYLGAEFWSGPFTCYLSTPADLAFDRTAISNNHLITASPGIRRALEGVHVGDQVHLRGLLVDYRMEDWGAFWRQTSKVRKDSGCEVVFLDELEILRRNAPLWHASSRVAAALLVALPLAWLALVVLEAHRGKSSLGEL